MEKRYFLALLLAAAVVALTQILFPVPRATSVVNGKTTQASADSAKPRIAVADTALPVIPPASVAQQAADTNATRSAGVPAPSAEATSLSTGLASYRFSNVGATPVAVTLRDYKNL